VFTGDFLDNAGGITVKRPTTGTDILRRVGSLVTLHDGSRWRLVAELDGQQFLAEADNE
jgi:hypothetical protein